jgi:hypothetical protein
VGGDANADVVVGAYRHAASVTVNGKPKTLKQAGAVYTYHCEVFQTCAPISHKYGEAAGDRLGYSVAAGGDIDNDGQNDIVAGAPGRDTTINITTSSGKVKVKKLKDVGGVYLLDGALGNPMATPVLGLRAGDNRGMYVTNSSDIDLDGYSDVITAAPKADTQVWVPSTKPGRPGKLKTIKDVGFIEVVSGKTATGH